MSKSNLFNDLSMFNLLLKSDVDSNWYVLTHAAAMFIAIKVKYIEYPVEECSDHDPKQFIFCTVSHT